jgi:LysM repeat protein
MKPIPAGISLLIACCCWILQVQAQEKLIIAGKVPDTYVVVKANGTENLQQISNQFGLSVAKLLSFNNSNINPAATLPRGTEIRIPVTKDNLLQSSGENSAPVYHIIRKGENLYRMTQYYAVSMSALRQWNKLNKDIVKDGQAIVVGYLVNARPLTAAKATEPPKENKEPAPLVADKKTPEKKDPLPVPAPVKKKDSLTAVAKNNPPAEKKEKTVTAPPVGTINTDNKSAAPAPKQTETKPAEQKPVVQNPPVVIRKDSVAKPVSAPVLEKKETVPVVEKKPEPVVTPPAEKPVDKPVEKKQPVVVADPNATKDYKPKEGDEGYYALGYAAHDVKLLKQFRSGEAAVFKTASGWSDRKFYVLMNDVPARTIIRITSSATGKSICAMVLGPLQEVKPAGGLMLRISNAAAAALGVNESRFNVSISYFIE